MRVLLTETRMTNKSGASIRKRDTNGSARDEQEGFQDADGLSLEVDVDDREGKAKLRKITNGAQIRNGYIRSIA